MKRLRDGRAATGYAFAPFTVYYLRAELGFSQSYILFLTSNNKYLPQICHKIERALSVSVLSASVGLVGGLAVTLWGFLLKNHISGSIDVRVPLLGLFY